MLNSFQDDPCCNHPLIRDIYEAKLTETDTWMCPKCGCTWKATIRDTIKHWEPVPMIEMLRV